MTFKEGCDKVLMLLDEYSSGGAITLDTDIKNKMAYFFDISQKQMANIKRIIRVYSVPLAAGVTEYAMPLDYNRTYRLWGDGKRFCGVWKGSKLIVPEKHRPHKLEVEYFAIPATVDASINDAYVFEIAEDAAQVMPFFVAQQQLITDLVVDYQALKDLYIQQLQTVDSTLPGAVGGGVRQTFFRGE